MITDKAQPLNLPGLPNAFTVTADLYRGARPTLAGLKSLHVNMLARTVIDLETWFDFDPFEAVACGWYGQTYASIPCSPWHPELEDVVKFLDLVRQGVGPFFVHCRQGADRTGMMCAIYRIAVCGWNKADAIDEMVNGGFGWNGWPQIVPFIEKFSSTFLPITLQLRSNDMTATPSSPLPTVDQLLAKIPTQFQQIAAPLAPGVLALANLGLIDIETWVQTFLDGNVSGAVSAAVAAMNVTQLESQMDSTNAAFDTANAANAARIAGYHQAISLLAGGIGGLISAGLLAIGL
jgi:hypothetical protein